MATQEPEKGKASTTTAVAKPYDVVATVAARLRVYTDKRELLLPANYSAENALKSAWLVLQETVDKNGKPVLQACSQASIANALLDMAVQGLNPGKKQCYFISYGTKLLCQRSYFGAMAVAKQVAGAKTIWAEIVYVGDAFEYEVSHNRKDITKHTQKLDNIKLGNIAAAYCVVEFGDDRPSYTEIMTMEQIRKAWAKSKMNPDAPSSAHSQFPEEMCKRTVINRACKAIINSSSDDNLFLEHFNRTDEEMVEDEVAAEIAEGANGSFIDVTTGEIVEPEGGAENTEPPEIAPGPEQKKDTGSVNPEGKQRHLAGPEF